MRQQLNTRLGQKQVLTPALLQMVNVLTLNKMELKEMIQAEVAENPVLEEIDETGESLAEMDGREAAAERSAEEKIAAEERTEKDAFGEIDLEGYFREYLEPGFRAVGTSLDDVDAPSFEHFLTKTGTLADHLMWQLGSATLPADVRAAAETLIGNLDANGYLALSAEDLAADGVTEDLFNAALAAVQSLDPLGVAARDLRECLLVQLRVRGREQPSAALDCAVAIVEEHLALVEKRDMREVAKRLRLDQQAVDEAMRVIRALDPRPGQGYNRAETRLIEPDVAFVRRGESFVAVMNEDDLPALRLNAGYRRMLQTGGAEREAQEYVRERFRAAIQLLRNIEQRKNMIVRTCEAILRRQVDFLEHGVTAMRPMLIKDVADEIRVHATTVSRAVANKYAHTPQGVFELRFFFQESVGGAVGADVSQMVVKQRLRKMIEEEDPRKPLTDDALAAELQRQGVHLTRRTVAKYREEMRVPSTHQRRQRD